MAERDGARSGSGSVVAALAPWLVGLGAAASSCATQNAGAAPPTRSAEVRFSSGGADLAGRLRLPQGTPPHPAVVLLAGSSPTRKEDEKLDPVAAAFLARGFAVLTTDSRGTGDSTGDFDAASFDLLAADAAATVAELRARADLRGDAIGLWGISQGATWVGPLAAERSRAAFLVAVSGPLVSPQTHVERFLTRRLSAAHALDDATLERIDDARAAVWDYYASGVGFEAASAAIDALRGEPWFSLAGLPASVQRPDELASLPLRTRTFLAQKDFDPLAALRRARCPILAVYGERDEQLRVAEHAETLRALARSGEADVAVELVPGADHDLRPVGGATAAPPNESGHEISARWAARVIAGRAPGAAPATVASRSR